MENKSTNPKDALGTKKAPTHLIPTAPLYELGLAMLEGGRKYGAHNFRDAGTRASVYYDAAKRHLDQWWEGEDIDPESGIHHLMKAAACCFVMRDSMFMGNEVDDRPIKYPNGLPIKQFNKQTKDIIERIPECKEPFTQAGVDSTKEDRSYAVGKHRCDCFPMHIPYGSHPAYFCGKCSGLRPVESKESEIYRGFKITNWGVMVHNDENNNPCGWFVDTEQGYLHKDCRFHGSTGYLGGGYGYGEAPGYYHSKAEARYYIDWYLEKHYSSLESKKPEYYRHFRIRKEVSGTRGWYTCVGDKKVLFLHKDLSVKSGTGYSKGNHGYGEAPGYYHSKAEATYYIDRYLEKHYRSLESKNWTLIQEV